jgi:hypothetical protein
VTQRAAGSQQVAATITRKPDYETGGLSKRRALSSWDLSSGDVVSPGVSPCMLGGESISSDQGHRLNGHPPAARCSLLYHF